MMAWMKSKNIWWPLNQNFAHFGNGCEPSQHI